MPQCCVLPMCSDKKGGHKFPLDKDMLQKWLVAIRRDKFHPSKHSRVCKNHFTPEDYEMPKDSRQSNRSASVYKVSLQSVTPFRIISLYVKNLYLDAVQLDDEVVDLYKTQLLETTKFLEPGILTPILPELDLLLRTVLFKYSVYDNGSTFGQQMLSLKYNENLISKSKLYWYYGYTVGLRYLKERAIYSFTSNRRIQASVESLERFQLIGDILNFLRFIQNGKCPRLIDYILNLEITADKITREDLSDFSWTRELLWNNFIELFGTVLSLTNMFDLRSKFLSMLRWSRWRKSTAVLKPLAPPAMTHSTVCASCRARPVLPHSMGCTHIFCFYCLKANKIADKDYSCPECHFNGSRLTKLLLS